MDTTDNGTYASKRESLRQRVRKSISIAQQLLDPEKSDTTDRVWEYIDNMSDEQLDTLTDDYMDTAPLVAALLLRIASDKIWSYRPERRKRMAEKVNILTKILWNFDSNFQPYPCTRLSTGEEDSNPPAEPWAENEL